MPFKTKFLACLFFGGAAIAACSSSSTNQPVVCEDGDVSDCTGADSCQGRRECTAGAWSECSCPSATDGTGGSSTSSGTTTTNTTATGGSGGTESTATGAGGSAGAGASGGTNASGGSGGSGTGGSAGEDGSGGTAGSGGSTTTTGTGGSGGSTATGGTGGTGGGPGDPTVHGTVVNEWLQPVPNVTVMLGDDEVTTNTLGEFEFEDVPETYDVMIDLQISRFGSGVGRYGWVYQGLTRRDPTLQLYGGLSLRSANVLYSPTNVTAGTDRTLGIAMGGDFATAYREGSNAVHTSFSYFGPAQITMRAHALQWEVVSGVPASYTAYDETSLLAFDSESGETEVALDMTEAAVDSGVISGTVSSVTSDNRYNTVYLRFASNAVIELVNQSPTDDSNFTYTVPNIPGSEIVVAAHEGYWSGEARSVAYQHGISPGQTSIELDIPAPPTLTAPAPGTTLDDETEFRWSSGASTFVWVFESYGYYNGLYVVTASKTITVPTFPNGLDLLIPSEYYDWRVETHGDYDTVDAMAGPKGYAGSYNLYFTDGPEGPSSASGKYTISAASYVLTPE